MSITAGASTGTVTVRSEGSTRPYLGILVPCTDTIRTDWAMAYANTIATLAPRMPFTMYWSKHYNIAYARNDITEKALAEGCRKLLYWDTDQYPFRIDGSSLIPFPQFVFRLMAHNYPIVCALHWLKIGAPNLLVMKSDDPTGYGALTGRIENFVGKLAFVDASSMGICLADARVFTKIEYPWFEYTRERTEQGHFEMAEDINFFRKCREAGFRVLVDGHVYSKHMGSAFHIWENTFEVPK